MPAKALSRSIATLDRIGTAIMPGALRHHGIVMNPHTNQPRHRPGRVGDIRFVRIDTRGHKRNVAGPVAVALDLLYADFQSSTAEVVETMTASLMRRHASSPPLSRSSQWDTPTDMVLRPLAARVEDDAVCFWAEVDPQAHEAHQVTGRYAFGDIVTTEPSIRRDAIIVSGRDLDDLSSASQARIEAKRAREAIARTARRRARGRKIGLTASFVGLLMALSIGATFLGSLLVVMLAASAIAVLHYSRNDERWASVERWLAATRDIQLVLPKERRPSIWTEIEQAVGRHAPERLHAVTQARLRIERLSSISEDTLDPAIHAGIASVNNGVRSLVETYRRPARLAVDGEARELAQDLAGALSGLAATADSIRSDALASARGDFDTQRRYLEARSEHAMLSPVG